MLYKYFYNPVATKLVEYLPETVAPNTLTVLGLLGTVIPFGILLGVCGCTLCGDVPAWFFFIHAITYFVYRMLDEMDGK